MMFTVNFKKRGFLVNKYPKNVAEIAITATISNSLKPINTRRVLNRRERHVAKCSGQLVALVEGHKLKRALICQ